MKKQKKPIVLLLILAVLLGGVFVISNGASSSGPEEKDVKAPAEKQEAVGSDVAKDMQTASKKDDAKKDVKRKNGLQGPAASKKFGGGPKGAHGEDLPSIFKPDYKPIKPKLNDSSTSTQWYTNESARNKPTN